MRILLIGLLLTTALFGMKHAKFAKNYGYETNYDIALKKAKAQKKYYVCNGCKLLSLVYKI